jgi:hypothetical protein
MITTKLWCFPKSMKTEVIPRYKIVDATFTYGPKNIPWPVYFLLLLGMLLVIIGLSLGGCRESHSYYDYYYDSSYSYAGACASSVLGFLVLLIPLPALLLVPCCFKK